MIRKISVVLAVAFAVVVVCKQAPADDKKGGVLKGKITFAGSNPDANKTDNTTKDPEACGADRPLGKLNVGADKSLEDAVVYVKDKLAGDFDAKFNKVTVDQTKCVYHAHVTFVKVGGEVVFKNSDSVAHNVKYSSTENGTFNQVIGPGKDQSVKLEKPEFITVECNVHPWMSALVVVMSHPYYTASDSKGEFELHLPAGKHKIMVQHQVLGKLEKKGVEVEIKEGETKTQNFEFK